MATERLQRIRDLLATIAKEVEEGEHEVQEATSLEQGAMTLACIVTYKGIPGSFRESIQELQVALEEALQE